MTGLRYPPGQGGPSGAPRSGCLVLIVLYKIRVGCGGGGVRHFNRGTVSPEMFIWQHLINPVG